MQPILLLTALLPLLAISTPLGRRAGGPMAQPIPTNCTVINALPHAVCGTANVNGYQPSEAFTNASLLYSAYFESSLSVTDQATQCLEQCNGYGHPGSCKSALVGYSIPTPPGYYGTAGGVLETACLLYSTYLDPNVFVPAPSGQYVNLTSGNIYCPS